MTDSCPPGLSKGYDHYDAVSCTPYPQNIPRRYPLIVDTLIIGS